MEPKKVRPPEITAKMDGGYLKWAIDDERGETLLVTAQSPVTGVIYWVTTDATLSGGDTVRLQMEHESADWPQVTSTGSSTAGLMRLAEKFDDMFRGMLDGRFGGNAESQYGAGLRDGWSDGFGDGAHYERQVQDARACREKAKVAAE